MKLSDPARKKRKKNLFGQDKEEIEESFIYKTPLESEVEDLKNELSVKEIELISANEYADSLMARYSDSGVTDKKQTTV